MRWSTKDIPDQAGRVAVVTGANGDLGLETARALAAAGAHVVLAARSPKKTAAAVAEHYGPGLLDGWLVDTVDAGAVERVEAAGICTSCEAELFFSHRRDAGRTGRQGSLAWIEA
jgi:NAD(P)-dependent dehydrogenase (short-subunit alcohol dehydrogenase family)